MDGPVGAGYGGSAGRVPSGWMSSPSEYILLGEAAEPLGCFPCLFFSFLSLEGRTRASGVVVAFSFLLVVAFYTPLSLVLLPGTPEGSARRFG